MPLATPGGFFVALSKYQFFGSGATPSVPVSWMICCF
jgi:hypothetical protein